MTVPLVLVAAYLLGSIPIGYIVPRVVGGIDIRTVGSGNPGFTNVYRAVGPRVALVVLLGDTGKGVLAILLARSAGAGEVLVVLAGVAAILGHVFTVFLRFRGGKGVLTAAGVFFSLIPAETLLCLILFVAIVAATRFVSLGSIVAAAALPVLAYSLPRLRGGEISTPTFLLSLFAAAVILIRHRSNLSRLLRGTESRFSFHRRNEP